jgi:hypothetical protein
MNGRNVAVAQALRLADSSLGGRVSSYRYKFEARHLGSGRYVYTFLVLAPAMMG